MHCAKVPQLMGFPAKLGLPKGQVNYQDSFTVVRPRGKLPNFEFAAKAKLSMAREQVIFI